MVVSTSRGPTRRQARAPTRYEVPGGKRREAPPASSRDYRTFGRLDAPSRWFFQDRLATLDVPAHCGQLLVDPAPRLGELQHSIERGPPLGRGGGPPPHAALPGA